LNSVTRIAQPPNLRQRFRGNFFGPVRFVGAIAAKNPVEIALDGLLPPARSPARTCALRSGTDPAKVGYGTMELAKCWNFDFCL